jgi:type IV secretion system protein VirD4
MNNGLILGLMHDSMTRGERLAGLFNPNVPKSVAVRRFMRMFYRKKPPCVVRLNDAIHSAVFAPSGSGKGVSFVIPHLLTCRDSMVVIDPKGENYERTADRRRKMGHQVVILDPFDVVGGRDTFNSLAEIDSASDSAPDEIRSVANAIVTRTGKEEEPFWTEAAEAEIALGIAFVVCFGDTDEKNLQSVRKVLSNGSARLAMIEACGKSDMWGGLLARWAGQSAQLQDKTLHSVMAHVHTFMRFLDTPPVMRSTITSSFDPSWLFSRKLTVFLCIPPNLLRSQAGLLRLWIGSLLRACVKNGSQEIRLVRFVLDESSSLGKLDCLCDAVDQYRGFGVRLLFIYQSLGQLKKCWPDGQDQTLLSNASQMFFAVNDLQTAEYVSNRLGEFTQVVASGGRSAGGSTSHQSGGGNNSSSQSWNTSDNWSQAARRLLKPEEVCALNQRECITFTPGRPPIWTWLIRYYEGIPSYRMGTLRVVVDTACIFLYALLMTVILTGTYILTP